MANGDYTWKQGIGIVFALVLAGAFCNEYHDPDFGDGVLWMIPIWAFAMSEFCISRLIALRRRYRRHWPPPAVRPSR